MTRSRVSQSQSHFDALGKLPLTLTFFAGRATAKRASVYSWLGFGFIFGSFVSGSRFLLWIAFPSVFSTDFGSSFVLWIAVFPSVFSMGPLMPIIATYARTEDPPTIAASLFPCGPVKVAGDGALRVTMADC
ncbi:hypothetical protein BDZ97DRAFT_1782109 [Flammula alnicola]|nr:hypothetical protein BDZ97DRAFT_1782109 [Flammula alnicola]